MKIRLASSLQSDSVVDGTGIRTVIWTQGCSHNCPGCHNPETHSFDGGREFDIEEIKDEISHLEGQTGITFSGGDPVFQIEPVIELSKYIHELKMDVWLYTGFKYEDICNMPKGKELLQNIDILVDGKFELKNRSLDAPFRGSTNQRIIDVKSSLKENKIVLVEDLMQKKILSSIKPKQEDIYI